jgi:hypothetical protein
MKRELKASYKTEVDRLANLIAKEGTGKMLYYNHTRHS